MKAITIHRYGGPEVMQLEERPEPQVGPKDVLIAVRAASLNPVDFKFREKKTWPMLRPALPVGLGCDAAGVVIAVGSGVTRFKVGDEVYTRLEKERMGGLAERVAADESVVAKKPVHASFAEAAALPLVCLTALQALREAAKVQAGQRVLVQAGAGGVGAHAIQIAKILSLFVVSTTSTKNKELVQSLGADRVVDYTKEDPRGDFDLDVIFDALGDELASLRQVKRGGVVVGIAGMPDSAHPMLPLWARPVVWSRTRERTRVAKEQGVRYEYIFMRPDGAQLEEIASWVDAKKLRAVLHGTFALAAFKEAFAVLESGKAKGKIVIEVA